MSTPLTLGLDIRSADLVPVFSFGENDIYMQLANAPGTRLHTFQKHFQKLFGFTLPVFHGRGASDQGPCLWRMLTSATHRRLQLLVRPLAVSPSHRVCRCVCSSITLQPPPLTTSAPFAVGRPISVTRNANPSKQELEHYQRLYIEELHRIWDTWKVRGARDRRRRGADAMGRTGRICGESQQGADDCRLSRERRDLARQR